MQEHLWSRQVMLGWNIRLIVYKCMGQKSLQAVNPPRLKKNKVYINSVKVYLNLPLWTTEFCKITFLIQSPNCPGVFQSLWPQMVLGSELSHVLNERKEKAYGEIQRRVTESEIML